MNNSDFYEDSELAENGYNEDIQLAENKYVDDDSEQGLSSEEKRNLLKKTKIVRQTWSIQEIYQKIKAERLDLSPDYQRNAIWRKDKQTAFIESLFMGILVPPIYVVEIPGTNPLDDSKYEVVDGKQRLTAIQSFLLDRLKLEKKSLEYYKDWFGGKSYSELINEHQALTFEMLSSVLDIYVITSNSPEFTKYDIFSRLNKGAEKLKVNEIRKAIYRSSTLDKIEEFDKSNIESDDDNIVNRYKRLFSENDIKRYEDFGRFYTSIAFYIRSDCNDLIVKGYNSRPRDMINNVLQEIQDNKIIIESEELQTLLEKTISLLEIFNDVDGKDYIINSCIPFVVTEWDSLESHLKEIELDAAIIDSLKKSPSTTSNVNNRFRRISEIIHN